MSELFSYQGLLSQEELEEIFKKYCFSEGTKNVILVSRAKSLLGEEPVDTIISAANKMTEDKKERWEYYHNYTFKDLDNQLENVEVLSLEAFQQAGGMRNIVTLSRSKATKVD